MPTTTHTDGLREPIVSTGSLYELDVPTEDAVALLAENGVRRVEVYLQCQEETTVPFLTSLAERCASSGVTVASVHPYVFGFENLLISTYTRQRTEAFRRYERFLEACHTLGAGIYVAHGPPPHLVTEDGALTANYVRTTRALVDLAAQHGVRYALENVSYGLVRSPADALTHAELFSDMQFVLDFKSAWKVGIDPTEFASAVSHRVALTHVSCREAAAARYGLCAGMGGDDGELGRVFRDFAAVRTFTPGHVVEVFGARSVEDVVRSAQLVRSALHQSARVSDRPRSDVNGRR